MGEKLQFTELDQYLFGQGTHYDIYRKLGAHPTIQRRKKGVYFAVWAPNARSVSVVGEFNNWNTQAIPKIVGQLSRNAGKISRKIPLNKTVKTPPLMVDFMRSLLRTARCELPPLPALLGLIYYIKHHSFHQSKQACG